MKSGIGSSLILRRDLLSFNQSRSASY